MKIHLYMLFLVMIPAVLHAQVTAYVETYSYDPAGRLTGVHYSNNASIQYTYDLAGNLTQLIAEDGITSSTNQDLPNQALSITVFPNPFYKETTFTFNTLTPANGTLTLYTILGEKVIHLPIPDFQPGNQTIHWNGKNETGTVVQPGMYICIFESGISSISSRFVKLD